MLIGAEATYEQPYPGAELEEMTAIETLFAWMLVEFRLSWMPGKRIPNVLPINPEAAAAHRPGEPDIVDLEDSTASQGTRRRASAAALSDPSRMTCALPRTTTLHARPRSAVVRVTLERRLLAYRAPEFRPHRCPKDDTVAVYNKVERKNVHMTVVQNCEPSDGNLTQKSP